MAITLFGFTIGRDNRQQELKNQSYITPVAEDGASTVSAGGYYGTYVDIDASARSESELITRYRDIANYPDVDTAVEEIVAEAIAAVDDEPPVSINIDNLDLDESIKDTIKEEFDEILSLLDFNDKGHDIFRRWYIDGRVYYQKVINTAQPKKGIQELRYIDPRKIRKVREVQKEKTKDGVELVKKIDEFFVYNEKGISVTPGYAPSNNQGAGIRISVDIGQDVNLNIVNPVHIWLESDTAYYTWQYDNTNPASIINQWVSKPKPLTAAIADNPFTQMWRTTLDSALDPERLAVLEDLK